MKRFLLASALAVILAGCGDKSTKSTSAPATNSTGGSLATAPVDYLNAAAKGEQSAVKTIDTTTLNQAIQLFYTDKGRYPKDLDELVAEKYIAKIPETPFGTKLDYDASSGTVKVVNQ